MGEVPRWSLAGVVQVLHHSLRGSCRGDPGFPRVPRRGGTGCCIACFRESSWSGLRASGSSPRGRGAVLGLGAALAEVSRRSCGVLVMFRAFVVSAEHPPQTSGRGTRSDGYLISAVNDMGRLMGLLVVLRCWLAGLGDDRGEWDEVAGVVLLHCPTLSDLARRGLRSDAACPRR